MASGLASKAHWCAEPERLVPLAGTGASILKESFGALSQSRENPLSRVSVANSSFSLDPFRGCPARCAYCTVAGAERDLEVLSTPDSRGRLFRLPAKPQQLFSGQAIVDALVNHPAFIPNRSIVSMCTASTEPFIPGVEHVTWEMVQRLRSHGLSNPLWFVTKLGVPDGLLEQWCERFREFTTGGGKVVVSITYANAPAWVEPYSGDRFRNVTELRHAGVHVSHHLRPLVPGINDKPGHLAAALEKALPFVEAVCVGGLRPDEGVTIAWEHAYGLSPDLLPESGREKVLSDECIDFVRAFVSSTAPHIPVFTRSSQAIAYLIGIADYNLYRYRPDEAAEDCLLNIPPSVAAEVQATWGRPLSHLLEDIVNSIALEGSTLHVRNGYVSTSRRLHYVEHRALIHAIGHSGLLP